MPASIRTSVFISYSHADLQWLRLLNTHLKPLTRDHKVEIWSDQKIRKGARWREQIHKQLAMARVGIFLISADFLASDFIHAEELPPLLQAAEKEGATLLTVIVRPCAGAFQDSPLSQLQSMNGPHAPLSGMNKNQREQVIASVYDELRSIFRTPARRAAAKPGTAAKDASAPAVPQAPKKRAAAGKPAVAPDAAAKAIARRRAIATNKAKSDANARIAKPAATPKTTVPKSATTEKRGARPTTRTPKNQP